MEKVIKKTKTTTIVEKEGILYYYNNQTNELIGVKNNKKLNK